LHISSGALKGIIEIGWENCLNTLVELFSHGVVEAGERGELVNRILFLMRYVDVAKEKFGPQVTYLEKVPLKSFLEKMNGHDELLDDLEINEVEVGFNHWISLLATNMDHEKSKGHRFLTKNLVKEAYHRHAAINMPFGFEHIDHIIPFKYPSGYGVISIQNKNAIYNTGDNFPLINPVSVFGESQEGYKILGIYTDINKGENQEDTDINKGENQEDTDINKGENQEDTDFNKGENQEKATSGLKSAEVTWTRTKSYGEKAKIIYIRDVEVFKFGDEINKRLFKILYTRPWPLDRYWSTFGENELDRKNVIRSFLPIVFEQEKGQSLIEKWNMDDYY
jgi:hypothetical protein